MGVVSYGIRIMEVLEEQHEELPELKVGIFGAETFSDKMREKIENGLGIEAFDIYGMTETGGVGTTGMGLPGSQRHPRLGRPVHLRNHRPRDRQGGARRRDRRGRVQLPCPRSHPGRTLPNR